MKKDACGQAEGRAVRRFRQSTAHKLLLSIPHPQRETRITSLMHGNLLRLAIIRHPSTSWLQASVQRPHCTQSQMAGDPRSSSVSPKLAMRNMKRGRRRCARRQLAGAAAFAAGEAARHVGAFGGLSERSAGLEEAARCDTGVGIRIGCPARNASASVIGSLLPCRQLAPHASAPAGSA